MRLKNFGAIIEDSIRADIFKTIFRQAGKAPVLLDLGCGARPYLDIYEPYFEKTIGADLADSPFEKYRVDIYCSATDITLENENCDVIFSSEVLHDISEPGKMLKEIYRVLKPGGKVVLSSPFMVPICDGIYDHFRYTKYGLQFLFSGQNFSNIKIVPVGNLFGVIIQLMIKPQLRIWNRLSKILHLKIINSLWNPFIFLFIFLPQATYLLFYHLSKKIKVLHKIGEMYSYSAIGYVSYAERL
jgi:SAM-dependent methyltransferase